MESKTCSTCKETKNISDFYKNKCSKSGLQNTCKICSNKSNKKSYEKYTEKILATHKEWKLANKKKIKLQSQIYYEKNKIYCLELCKLYYQSNIDKVKETHKTYYRYNRYKFIHRSAKRRAFELNCIPPWADLNAIKKIYQERDKISKETGITYHVDHIVPIQGKNVCGLHVANNLRVIPAKENFSKSNKFLEDLVESTANLNVPPSQV